MRSRTVCLLLVLLAAAAPALLAQPGEGDPRTGADARVRPGDRISLRIFLEPQMSDTFAVSEAGDVALPRLGVVRVAGQTAGRLQDSLRVAYARYLRDPSIEVQVLRRIAVGGEVRKPDLYMVDLTMTLREVLALAGGVAPDGDPRRIEIIREGRRVRLAQDEQAQFLTAELSSGDQVVVGRRSWFSRNPNVAIGTGMALVSFFIGVVQLLDNN